MITNQSSEALEFLESLIGKKPTFGEYLLAIRESEEMTQADFSKQLGVSRHYLCDIERKRRYVSPKAAAEFAEKLGYSSKQFVRLCLQDMLNRDGLNLLVDIQSVA